MSDSITFKGKNVIVLGASSGIGRDTAMLLAKLGARVAVGARRIERLEALVEEMPGNGHAAIRVDVSDVDGLRKAIDAAVDKLGGTLHAMVNSAGGGSADDFKRQEDVDVFESMFRLNSISTYVAAEAAFPHLEKTRGAIVSILSTHGSVIHQPGSIAYSTSKAAALEMTKCLAMKYAASGVRINALSPASTATELHETTAAIGGITFEDNMNFQKKFHPMQRVAESIEVARSAAFLVSDWATFTTGDNLLVDGGCSVSSWWNMPEQK